MLSPELQVSPGETIPALGRLSRIPRELRDMVYELTLVTSGEEASINTKCTYKPHSILTLTSKTLCAEVTSFINRPHIDRPQGWPCKHTHFTYLSEGLHTRRSPSEEAAPRNRTYRHGLAVMGHCFADIRQLRINDYDMRTLVLSIPITGWTTRFGEGETTRFPTCAVERGDDDWVAYMYGVYSGEISRHSSHEVAIERAIARTIVEVQMHQPWHRRAERLGDTSAADWDV